MALREYKCSCCGFKTEIIVKTIAYPSAIVCPKCGRDMLYQIGTPGFRRDQTILKGNGKL